MYVNFTTSGCSWVGGYWCSMHSLDEYDFNLAWFEWMLMSHSSSSRRHFPLGHGIHTTVPILTWHFLAKPYLILCMSSQCLMQTRMLITQVPRVAIPLANLLQYVRTWSSSHHSILAMVSVIFRPYFGQVCNVFVASPCGSYHAIYIPLVMVHGL